MIKILLGLLAIVIFTRITNRLKELFPRLTTWLGDGDSDGLINFDLFGDDGDDSGDD